VVVGDSNFIRACRGRNAGRIPVWIMRQAGRYLPEYQEIRQQVSFQELCRTPRLIAEVVRQPVERYGLDAAILFSDILTILEPMGVKVDFPEGGPQLEFCIGGPADVKKLSSFNVKSELSFVLDGIREIKKIFPDTPLIGFAGSPFTLACYLIEGQGSKNFNQAKKFLYQYPRAAEEMFDLLTRAVTEYLEAQIDAGADAIQLFDSWGGVLSKDDYYRWSARSSDRIFQQLASRGVPRILFVNNIAPYLDLVSDIDCEVVGVDYRIDLAEAALALSGKSIQGNLDPAVLFAGPGQVVRETTRILESLPHHRNYIFNLGHGILPETPLESVQAMVETVHNFKY
jgi:uroporphyrinogen decarboxylase